MSADISRPQALTIIDYLKENLDELVPNEERQNARRKSTGNLEGIITGGGEMLTKKRWKRKMRQKMKRWESRGTERRGGLAESGRTLNHICSALFRVIRGNVYGES